MHVKSAVEKITTITHEMKKKVQKKPSPALLSRKAKRQELRKNKKLKKQQFLQRKFKQNAPEVEEKVEVESAKAKQMEEQKEMKKKSKAEAVKKEQEKKRRKRLRQENELEEKNLKKLEKQLHLNKRKKLPASFKEDGLDYLLDICDSEKVAKMKDIESEEEEDEMDDEDDLNEDQRSGDEELENEEEMCEDEDEEKMLEEDDESVDHADVEEDELDDEDDNEEINEDDEEELDDEDGKEEEDDDEEDLDDEGGKDKEETWEDIYGRKRDSSGNVIKEEPAKKSAYIPPALRAKLAGSESNKEKLDRLKRRINGLLNRLATSNMSGILSDLEKLYRSNSRHDMNQVISDLLHESLIDRVKTPERLIMEHALLVNLLHINIGVEVGAAILQNVIEIFERVWEEEGEEEKSAENALLLICYFYSFKMFDACLIVDILEKLLLRFSDKDIELIILILRSVGFTLRKDDPAALKSVILQTQKISGEKKEKNVCSRTKFMLETLLAIKNNNVKKIPNYDNEHHLFLLKSMKQWMRPGMSTNPFKVRLSELLEADTRGRWWIVGSAWTGSENRTKPEVAVESHNEQLLELARKMRMNTEARKMIFCTVMSSEDYMDAFENILKLMVKGKQKEREVIFVLLDCCLQEKSYNAFYAHIAAKLAKYDRKYRLAAQFSIWDKIKEGENLKKFQLINLSSFHRFLIEDGVLSLASLKVIEFANLDKTSVSYLKKVLIPILTSEDEDKIKAIFTAVAGYPKLKVLREGLRLFVRHFLQKDADISSAESFMMSSENKFATL